MLTYYIFFGKQDFLPGSTRILGPLATLRRFGPYCITSRSDVITPETQPLSTLSVITVIQ